MSNEVDNLKQALKAAYEKINELNSAVKRDKKKEAIAIIGYSCRFPGGANSPQQFWEVLRSEKCAVTDGTKGRFNSTEKGGRNIQSEPSSLFASYLDVDINRFDCTHFDLMPNEVASMDPQQRLLMEVSWEALTNAGIDISGMRGSKTGVFIGMDSSEFCNTEMFSGNMENITPYSLLGSSTHSAAGRLSYFYDLKGPAQVINTACSSSLVALSSAVQSLKNGQCDMAIVGGVNLLMTREAFAALEKMNSLAPDGKCKTFDEAADGFGRGEGCGVCVLKRLQDAKQDENIIEAIIRGISVGQDGKTNGFFAPNAQAERNVIREALKEAGLNSNDVDYIEAHGTGTKLGDLFESQAVTDAYCNRNKKILIGSVKSNIGHLEAASGMASLIKVLLALKHKKIPASINISKPNSLINWEGIEVVRTLLDWEKETGKRRAGINSFGISGTLVHAIIEEPEEDMSIESNDNFCNVLTLATKTGEELRLTIEQLIKRIKDSDTDTESLIKASNIRLNGTGYRMAFVGKNRDELIKELEKALSDKNVLNNLISVKEKRNGKVVFLFTGQGSVYNKIACDLFERSDVFRESFLKCRDLFMPEIGFDLQGSIDGREELFEHESFVQALIFTVEYALFEFWLYLGVKPDMVIGHSIGEFAAACCAGILSLEDAVKLVSVRGTFMEELDINGKMVGVLAGEDKVSELLKESGCKKVSIAAVNAKENVTISGDADEIGKVVELIRDHRIFTKELNIKKPYHSNVVRDHVDAFLKKVGKLEVKKGNICCISGVYAGEDQLMDEKYWSDQLCSKIEFTRALSRAVEMGAEVFLEIGGDATLSGLASQDYRDERFSFLPSLRKGVNASAQISLALKDLYMRGYDVNFKHLYRNTRMNDLGFLDHMFFRKDIEDHFCRRREINVRDERGSNLMTENNKPGKNVKGRVLDELKEMICSLTSFDKADVREDANLFSLGIDSLILVALNRKIENNYHITIALNDFFLKLDSLDKIAGYIVENGVAETTEEEQVPVLPKAVDKVGMSEITPEVQSLYHVFNQQIELLNEQNNIIRALFGKSSQEGLTPGAIKKVLKENSVSSNPSGSGQIKEKKNNDTYVPYHKLNVGKTGAQDSLKSKYIDELKHKYIELTCSSRDNIQKYRPCYANNRNVAGFRMDLKDMLYQIVVEKARGSKVYDLKGNEFIDLTMGFGVNLFGHSPEFIVDALKEEIEHGFPLGPMGRLAGQVAERITRLTKTERVAFYNSGTEANMVAVRIAKAITSKKKTVVFAGSYHGMYDGLLGLQADTDGERVTIPLAPGVNENIVKDLIILDYDSEDSLSYIESHASDIGAVLVETVQSRKPNLQPREFLKKLRGITEQNNIALIFDEIITGFRIRAGGAQEFFGIQADIVTMGKIVGGGMPIGVVAGKAKYLDSIDGGFWQYGDDSVPTCNEKRTFVAGTFSHHPMAMAAANALLRHIEENKETIYPALNRKTESFVNRLNGFFTEEEVPIKVVYFGSLFRFVFGGDYEVFYYGMIQKGIYIWEGRNCFISTEHSDEDLDKIFLAVKETIHEMREAGYFGNRAEEKKNKTSYCTSPIQDEIFAQISILKEDPFAIVAAYSVEGDLSVERLEKAIVEIINRHEILRTALVMNGEKLEQSVHSSFEFKIRRVHCDSMDNISQCISENLCTFDLGEPVKLEALLIENETQDRKIIVFHVHHIAGDGISMNILVRELKALYEGAELKPIKYQYRDFAEKYREILSPEKLEQSRAYWSDILQDVTPRIPIGDIDMTNREENCASKTILASIPADLTERIGEIAKEKRASKFCILLTLLQMVLHKITGEKNIAIATPVSNRLIGEFDDNVGMFTNTIVIQSSYDGNKVFSDFLDECRNQYLNSFSYCEYPYSYLLKALNMSGEDAFNVIFTYENVDERDLELENVCLKKVDYDFDKQEFDITIEALEQDGVINIYFRYKDNKFSEKYAQDILDRYVYGIGSLENNVNRKLYGYSLTSPEERERILNSFNPHAENDEILSLSMEGLFLESVEKDPEKIALKWKDRALSYAELNGMSDCLANELEERGIQKDDIVLVYGNKCPEIIVSILAAIKAGGAYCVIDPNDPPERVRYIIGDCDPKIILTEYEDIDFGVPSVCWGKYDFKKETVRNNNRISAPDDLAYCIYTSGTTGVPKGTLIERKSVIRLVKNVDYTELNESTIMIQAGALSFDASTFEIWGALLNGGTLILAGEDEILDSRRFQQCLSTNRVNTMWLTAALYNYFVQDNVDMFKGIKYLLTGGEKLTDKFIRLLQDNNRDIQIINGYGPTENTTFTTTYKIPYHFEKMYIGRPIPHTQVYILEGDELCGVGVPGELCIAGLGLARGYLNNEKLTNERFVKNPFGEGMLYRSGDLAKWNEDGNIDFLGRLDDQVKIRGFRIEPEEIKNVLCKIERIKDAVVIVRQSGEEKILCAYIVADGNVDVSEIRKELEKQLPNYMIPGQFMQIDKIPITKNGKVDKTKLPEIITQVSETYEAPSGQIEQDLADVLMDVLNVKNIGVNDNFFEMGGDSIKAIRIVSKLREKGYETDVRDIIRLCTVRKIAKILRVVTEPLCEQGEVVGTVISTPIINDFRKWNLKNPACFTQSQIIYINTDDENVVKKALKAIMVHHDILRSVYSEGVLRIKSSKEADMCDFMSVNCRDRDDLKLQIRKWTEKYQNEMDPERGPLVKAVMFRCTDDRPLLWICIHHLLVDGVSWRILLEDIENAIHLAEQNKEVVLPPKTDSFLHWAELTEEYKNSSELANEIPYWEKVVSAAEEGRIDSGTKSDEKGYGQLRFIMTDSETERLLNSNKAFNTEINDLLLSALVQTMHKVFNLDKAVIGLEGHGREKIHKKAVVDRTVGWFTTIYPIVGDYKPGIRESIIETKEMLRSVPNKGMGYSLLKDRLPQINIDVFFNYFGQMIEGGNGVTKEISDCVIDRTVQENGLFGLLNLNGVIENGCLSFTIDFDRSKLSTEEMEKFRESYYACLKETADYCCSREDATKTVSDYDSNDLTGKDLDMINSFLDGFDE